MLENQTGEYYFNQMGENIIFSTDDKQKALNEFSKMENPKDDRPSTRVELYERIAKKK